MGREQTESTRLLSLPYKASKRNLFRADAIRFDGRDTLSKRNPVRFDPENPNLVLDGPYAAAYLGVSKTTLCRLRKRGLLPAFKVPSSGPGARMVWRYPCMALHEFIQTNSGYTRFEHPLFERQFPVKAIADLLGVSVQDVKIQKLRGRLKDYRAGSVRHYLLNVSRKRVSQDLRRQYSAQLRRLREEVRRYRRLLKSTHCECCRQIEQNGRNL
jgi:hypothetical protein